MEIFFPFFDDSTRQGEMILHIMFYCVVSKQCVHVSKCLRVSIFHLFVLRFYGVNGPPFPALITMKFLTDLVLLDISCCMGNCILLFMVTITAWQVNTTKNWCQQIYSNLDEHWNKWHVSHSLTWKHEKNMKKNKFVRFKHNKYGATFCCIPSQHCLVFLFPCLNNLWRLWNTWNKEQY